MQFTKHTAMMALSSFYNSFQNLTFTELINYAFRQSFSKVVGTLTIFPKSQLYGDCQTSLPPPLITSSQPMLVSKSEQICEQNVNVRLFGTQHQEGGAREQGLG